MRWWHVACGHSMRSIVIHHSHYLFYFTASSPGGSVRPSTGSQRRQLIFSKDLLQPFSPPRATSSLGCRCSAGHNKQVTSDAHKANGDDRHLLVLVCIFPISLVFEQAPLLPWSLGWSQEQAALSTRNAYIQLWNNPDQFVLQEVVLFFRHEVRHRRPPGRGRRVGRSCRRRRRIRRHHPGWCGLG